MSDLTIERLILFAAVIITAVTIINSMLSISGFLNGTYHKIFDIVAIIVTLTVAFLNLRIFSRDRKNNFYCLVIANLLLAAAVIHALRIIFGGLLC